MIRRQSLTASIALLFTILFYYSRTSFAQPGPDPIALAAAGQDPSTIDCSSDPTTRCEGIKRRLMVGKALGEVSAEFNVPLQILEAIAYGSFWSFVGCDPATYKVQPIDRNANITPGLGAHLTPHQYAPMGLCDDPLCGSTLFKAAELLKIKPEEVACDYKQNIRGAAALLDSLRKVEEGAAGASLGINIESWKTVIEKFSGYSRPEISETYAADIYKVLLNGVNEYGVSIEAHPELYQFIESSFPQDGILKKKP